jgi:hypothetical protein
MHKIIFDKLRQLAPSLSVQVIWTHDDYSRFAEVRHCCKGGPSKWQAWNSEVRATIIDDGHIISGKSYLGGTWERANRHPSKSNPNISGYLPQMVEEALQELRLHSTAPEIKTLLESAIATVRQIIHEDYEQKIELAPPRSTEASNRVRQIKNKTG